MSTDLQRRALLADLTRHLAPLSLDALRLIDRWTLALQIHEQEHGPIDLLALRRMIPRFDPRAPVETAIVAALCAVGIELAIEDEERAGLREAARDEMFPAPAQRTVARETVSIGNVPGDGGDPMPLLIAPMPRHLAAVDEPDRVIVDGFALDQHLTRIDGTSAVIALAEVPRDRDEDLEVELEWDLSDIHAGEGS